ncbi:MAG: VOC family protein [Rhodospirillales bacterium]|nr:VOC family protein [Rhodospirillales bacterium]
MTAASTAGIPTQASPLWPARLDHIVRESDRPAALIDFYRDAIGMTPLPLGPGQWLMQGPDRRLVVAVGTRGAQPLSAFCLNDAGQLAALKAWLLAKGLALLPVTTPLFAEGFALRDPDGRLVAFGLPDPADKTTAADLAAARLSGRLQHVVVATNMLPRLVAFYEDALGFVVSDHVWEGEPGVGDVTATFLRSDPEHHSFAAFRAPEIRPDHHCFETTCWNDIRDWADHMGGQGIKLWWGPGRHGPGNNLFFMVEDPDGHKVELSAEIEVLPRDMPARAWRHEERTLNLWGQAWMRS